MNPKLTLCGVAVLAASSLAFAKYKPNGPPLFVCAGAVPLEPNTNRLPQTYFRNTDFDSDNSLTIVATTREDFDKGKELLGNNAKVEFDKSALHVFHFHGKVVARMARNNGIDKLPTSPSIEVFGIERVFVGKRNARGLLDQVTIHIVSHDADFDRAVSKHSPGLYYKIPYNNLDTEQGGTPPVTKSTKFHIQEHRVVTKHQFREFKKP